VLLPDWPSLWVFPLVVGLLPCVPDDDGVDAWLPLGVCVADPPWLADWLVV